MIKHLRPFSYVVISLFLRHGGYASRIRSSAGLSQGEGQLLLAGHTGAQILLSLLVISRQEKGAAGKGELGLDT